MDKPAKLFVAANRQKLRLTKPKIGLDKVSGSNSLMSSMNFLQSSPYLQIIVVYPATTRHQPLAGCVEGNKEYVTLFSGCWDQLCSLVRILMCRHRRRNPQIQRS